MMPVFIDSFGINKGSQGGDNGLVLLCEEPVLVLRPALLSSMSSWEGRVPSPESLDRKFGCPLSKCANLLDADPYSSKYPREVLRPIPKSLSSGRIVAKQPAMMPRLGSRTDQMATSLMQ